MKKTHYYLVDKSGVTPGAAVSTLQFNIIQEEPFTVRDLEVRICDTVSSFSKFRYTVVHAVIISDAAVG